MLRTNACSTPSCTQCESSRGTLACVYALMHLAWVLSISLLANSLSIYPYPYPLTPCPLFLSPLPPPQVVLVEARPPGLYKDSGQPWKSPYRISPPEGPMTDKWLLVSRGHSERFVPMAQVGEWVGVGAGRSDSALQVAWARAGAGLAQRAHRTHGAGGGCRCVCGREAWRRSPGLQPPLHTENDLGS